MMQRAAIDNYLQNSKKGKNLQNLQALYLGLFPGYVFINAAGSSYLFYPPYSRFHRVHLLFLVGSFCQRSLQKSEPAQTVSKESQLPY
jgi:hypothetical protein